MYFVSISKIVVPLQLCKEPTGFKLQQQERQTGLGRLNYIFMPDNPKLKVTT